MLLRFATCCLNRSKKRLKKSCGAFLSLSMLLYPYSMNIDVGKPFSIIVTGWTTILKNGLGNVYNLNATLFFYHSPRLFGCKVHCEVAKFSVFSTLFYHAQNNTAMRLPLQGNYHTMGSFPSVTR
jgi:hypothetical protein